MGYGDQILATGMARGAHARGELVAFGCGKKIRWDGNSELIFRGNINIAKPGQEREPNLRWVGFYKGCRVYNHHDRDRNRWVWNYKFKATPGEMFFSTGEKQTGERAGKGFVLIEPNVEAGKIGVVNKDWGRARYQQLAWMLKEDGFRVAQFVYGKTAGLLDGVLAIHTKDFRDALSVLANASLYVGPEGGLHHGAAALNVPGVVIFGAWIPPQVTGYDTHTNLAVGEACGSLSPCPHCRAGLDAISVEDVYQAAKRHLTREPVYA